MLTQFIVWTGIWLSVANSGKAPLPGPVPDGIIPGATSSCGFVSQGVFLPAGPRAEKESINWRNRRLLGWSDFRANPVAAAPNAALTSTSILINYGYDESSLTYQIRCVFYPDKSWTKVNSSHILAHEQGHFDITQLFTRKLQKALSEYRFKAASVDNDVQKIYQQVSIDQAAYQQLYDTETNYSRDAASQERWIRKINEEIRALEAYANYPQ